MQKNKETCSTWVHGGRGLELVNPAHEPVSSRPKLCASPKSAPRGLFVRRSLLAPAGTKQAMVRDQFSPRKPLGSRL